MRRRGDEQHRKKGDKAKNILAGACVSGGGKSGVARGGEGGMKREGIARRCCSMSAKSMKGIYRAAPLS